MLRTNCKQVKNDIWQYVKDTTSGMLEGYENPKAYNLDNDAELAAYLWDIFEAEKYYSIEYIKAHSLPMYKVFRDWTQGLPTCGLGEQWVYNPNPIDIIGDILEQTEGERNKYTEEQAAELLTTLIYREITERKERR